MQILKISEIVIIKYLRGGKAIADKASGGSISMPITPQELKVS